MHCNLHLESYFCSACNSLLDSNHGLFHPSWLLCVYQRMFHSENKSLMREGVCHLLELQVLQQPQFALAFSQVHTQPQLLTCFFVVVTFFSCFVIVVTYWTIYLKMS